MIILRKHWVLLRTHYLYMCFKLLVFIHTGTEELKVAFAISAGRRKYSLVCRDVWKMSEKWKYYRCSSEGVYMEVEEIGIKTQRSGFRKYGRTKQKSWPRQRIWIRASAVWKSESSLTTNCEWGSVMVPSRGAASVTIITYIWEVTDLRSHVMSCPDAW